MVEQVLPGRPQDNGTGARTQGRPLRGANEIGRERLIETTREMLKNRPRFEVQRREIADFAKVTPALVTYHFPDKWKLFEEATASVIDEYVSRIQFTVGTPNPDVDTLRALIELFVIFHVEHGSLLDNYIELIAANRLDRSRDKLLHVQSTVRMFLVTLTERGLFKRGDVDLLQTALWGASKYLGETLKFRADLSAEETHHRISASVETILGLFVTADAEQSGSGVAAPV